MDKTPIWKPILIIATIVLAILGMIPPSQRLKLGLDLSGGTTFLYQVNVPASANSESELDAVIEVLRNRIDPSGLRNLVFRKVAGDRIEIQMAHASKDVKERRQQYYELRDQMLAANITEAEIDHAMRLPNAERVAEFAALAGGNEHVIELLQKAAVTFDALQAAQEPQTQLQSDLDAAEAALDELDDDAAEQRTQLLAHMKGIRSQLIEAARAQLAARSDYFAARQAVLETTISSGDWERIAILFDSSRGRVAESLKTKAVDNLIAAHPDRKSTIEETLAALKAYNEIKGPLDDPADLIALLQSSGVLEFRIAPAPSKVPNASEYVKQIEEAGPKSGRNQPYIWLPIDDISAFAKGDDEKTAAMENTDMFFMQRGLIGHRYAGQPYLLVSNTPGAALTQAQEGWKLDTVYPTADQYGGAAISFSFDSYGSDLFARLTGEHVHEAMAIALDGEIVSAPVIQQRLNGGGIITGGEGGFTPYEQQYLIRTLKAGSLKSQLSEEPISVQTINATFGNDNLISGMKAAGIALVLVGVFMISYYFFFGFVANIALIVNLVLVVGAMAISGSVFTLPGIAGLVLTIGMAVDANVLVFERIREELERKANARTAVRLGYQRALSTIIDSNLTTLLTCIVLYYTATADLRGFALVLGLGVVANVFTGVFVSRVLTDLYLQIVKPKQFRMLPMVLPGLRKVLSPNIHWISKRNICFAVSGTVCVLGIVAIATRGQDMLDIEFRSGTQVTFELGADTAGNPLTLRQADARERLKNAADKLNQPMLASANVVSIGDATNGEYHSFSVSTLETDAGNVTETIKEAFSDVLDKDRQRPIHFQGESAEHVNDAPRFPVRTASLGESIGRQLVQNDVSSFVGGVAFVLDGLEQPVLLSDVETRIRAMQLAPSYEQVGVVPFAVIGLEKAASVEGETDARYNSLAVLVRDDTTNYVENPEAVDAVGGMADVQWNLIRDAMLRDTSLGSVTQFSPQISSTIQQQAIAAMFLACLAILIYIWFRFGSLRYGLAAIIALVHDVLVALSILAIAAHLSETTIGDMLGITAFRLDLAQVAAFLTLIGYSLNDTIVVFDRVRENRGRLATASPAIINDSINQTISRTVLTGSTTAIAVFLLYVIGGPGVHGFAFTMLVGVVVGTYSSIAIAAPTLLIGQRFSSAFRKSDSTTSPAPTS